MPTHNRPAARKAKSPTQSYLTSRPFSFWLLMLMLMGGSLRLAGAEAGLSSTIYLPQVLSQAPRTEPIYPNDFFFTERQWTLRQINAPGGWRITTGGEVIIAIIDSGVDYDHPDLAGHFVDPALWRNFVNDPTDDRDDDPTDPNDYNGHGTHVAGIIAAASNNGQGITGVSWGARILPLKVLRNRDGAGPISGIAQAIEYAADNGAQIINLSLGGRTRVQALQDAITYARSKGVLVVASAGNYFHEDNAPSYPGAMDGVVAVAGTTINDSHSCYSNVGDYVDVAAPGGQGGREGGVSCNGTKVWSTIPLSLSQEGDEHRGYGWKSGTSMAAPHVAGLAALLLSERPGLTHDELEAIIESNADDLGDPGRDSVFGAGRINARRALEAVWYLNHPVNGQLQAEAAASYAPATDCDVPHVTNHLLVRASEAGDMAALRTNSLRDARLLDEIPNWEVWQVTSGQACALVQELNSTEAGVVAELDLLYSTTD
ncbi:MAG TPA: S8 family peptidase [Ardenticatenaceae bacterium]|jgi:subtilisin family serine protease